MGLSCFIRNAADFARIVELGQTPESDVLEFKREFDGYRIQDKAARRSAQKELCRDVSSFGNADGGCLLIGIGEDRRGPHRVAARIVPVEDIDGSVKWIEQAIANFLVPSTIAKEIVKIDLREGSILAVNVPASRHLVSVWDRDDHSIQCLHRTNHGKEYMNPDEVERHLMNGSRAARLAVVRAVEEATQRGSLINVHLASRVLNFVRNSNMYVPVARCWLGIDREKVGPHEFELRYGTDPKRDGRPVRVPYGLVREAWVTAAGSIGLALSARIVVEDDEPVLEAP